MPEMGPYTDEADRVLRPTIRRDVMSGYGSVFWVSLILLIAGIVQVVRYGLGATNYTIQSGISLATFIAAGYLYWTLTDRIDVPDMAYKDLSLFKEFVTGAAQSLLFWYPLYVAFLGLWTLYGLTLGFSLGATLAGLLLLLGAFLAYQGQDRLRRMADILDRMDEALRITKATS